MNERNLSDTGGSSGNMQFEDGGKHLALSVFRSALRGKYPEEIATLRVCTANERKHAQDI